MPGTHAMGTLIGLAVFADTQARLLGKPPVDQAYLQAAGLPADVAKALAAALARRAEADRRLMVNLETRIQGGGRSGEGKGTRAPVFTHSSVTTTTLDFDRGHAYRRHSETTRSAATYPLSPVRRPSVFAAGSNESSEAGGYLVTGPGELLLISNEGYVRRYEVEVSSTELVLKGDGGELRYWRG